MGELPETASISTIFTTLRPPGSGEDGGSDKPSEPVGDSQNPSFPGQKELRQMLRWRAPPGSDDHPLALAQGLTMPRQHSPSTRKCSLSIGLRRLAVPGTDTAIGRCDPETAASRWPGRSAPIPLRPGWVTASPPYTTPEVIHGREGGPAILTPAGG
jgi:hypothetical protein